MADDFRQSVYNLLQQLPQRKLDALKQLFWSELNCDRANTPLSTRGWPQAADEALAEPPTLFATAGDNENFHIIYGRLQTNRLLLSPQRPVITRLLQEHPYALFIFSDNNQTNWHFVNVRYEKDGDAQARRVFRRITVGPRERLRTATERISMLDMATLSPDLFGLSPLVIQKRHDDAFDVEAVTDQFFKGYKNIFESLQADLTAQTRDPRWAHDYALQFLNRLMFLYYVQRKRWLDDNPDFLAHLWQSYREAARPKNAFVNEWLEVMFFEAFNNQFQAGRPDRRYLPEDIRNALALAPYLNGGLFIQNDLDRKYQANIADSRFRQIFDFLEHYNFTISEDTPLDQEVAVDPEMIGKVYESLVNVSEEADERGEAGIFYTPRVEIDLMCRLALVNWLANRLPDTPKSLLYELIFAFTPEDKEQADGVVAQHNLWPRLDNLLRNVTVADPACGSGSFLMGMLYVLDDLIARANQQLGRQETPYDRKKRIIGNSLYGVDVMHWAVHVAELRLWLQLVIDTELHPAQLQFLPLLPNLSFKIRPGDSLVQEVGSINLALHSSSGRLISKPLKGRITQLKGEKLKYYNNDPQRKYHSMQELQHAELQILRDILDERVKAIDDRLKGIKNALQPQVNLFGEVQDAQLSLDRTALEQEQDRLQTERERIIQARQALSKANSIPFVWDIAFVEIFEGDRDGFDIVIGNPPYVRQEMIRDPQIPPEKVTTANKKEYKAKLANSVYAAWPQTFDWGKSRPKWKLNAKSDLYIYFYFHGLSLLNNDGIFCFITSNSWLDVGYGGDLQEFLLTRGKVNLVLDNENRRSFASADVNTVIVLLGAAQDATRPISTEYTARFVMLTIPFEQTLNPILWEEIDETTTRSTTLEYRVFPISQSNLFQSGIDPTTEKFTGDKWGGKYLRAPDIYWTILDKGKHLLKPMSEYFVGERYLNTGGADGFFILTDVTLGEDGIFHVRNEHTTSSKKPPFEGEIEERFLIPLVKDFTKTDKRVEIRGYDAYCLVVLDEPSSNLKRYIEWGETQKYHKRGLS